MPHTPGPWKMDRDRAILGQGHGTRGLHGAIADVYSWVGTEEADANARLIAAAPELLEALKALSDGTTANWTAKLNAARAAIAKAQGRS